MSLLWRGGVLLLWFDMIQRQASLLRDSPLLTGRSLIKRSRERSIYSSVESLQTSHFYIYICFPLVFGGVQIWQHSYGCVSAWLMNESELLLVSVGPAQPWPASGSLGLNVTFSGGGAPRGGCVVLCLLLTNMLQHQQQPGATLRPGAAPAPWNFTIIHLN